MSAHSLFGACLKRRAFLIGGGASFGALAVPGFAADARLAGSRYPANRVGSLDNLKLKQPLEFAYPNNAVVNVLVRLGEPAGGGVGPLNDIVAFNATCTHMGGPVGADAFKPAHNVLGPCPLHLTTFDLTRHGMVVSGHATESLPQIMLEIRDDDIFAVGVMGLIFGYAENPHGA